MSLSVNLRKAHYDVTDKNNYVSSEDLNRLITNIPACPVILAEMLAIMFVLIFSIAVILYLKDMFQAGCFCLVIFKVVKTWNMVLY